MPSYRADAYLQAAQSPFSCDGLSGEFNPACKIKDFTGDAAGAVASGAVSELAQAVVGAANEVLGAVLEFISAPIRPDLDTDLYVEGFGRMVAVSGVFATVLFLLGLIQAVARRSLSDLGRVVGYTVGAFAATGVLLYLAQGFVALVDVATAQVAAGAPQDAVDTFEALMSPLTALAAGSLGKAFLAVLLGLGVALGALAIYLELFLRAVTIHVLVYFLPLMLIGSIWEPTRRWAKRGIEFLAVVIFSKFVLFSVVALGWSAVSSFGDQRLSTSWASVLTGLVLLIVAAFLPYLLFKLLPFMEAHVGRALAGRHAGRIASAPISPVTASMRTLDTNLGRVSRIAALFAGGAGGASAAAGAATAGKSGAGQKAMPPAATGSAPPVSPSSPNRPNGPSDPPSPKPDDQGTVVAMPPRRASGQGGERR